MKPKSLNAELAEMALDPSMNGAAVLQVYDKRFGQQDLAPLMLELHDRIQRLRRGDLSDIEAMLLSQATALQAIFVDLATRAQRQKQLPLMQAQLNLALKAQAQCRATLEALAEVKNPRHATFVQQQNIAQQQQVINGGPPFMSKTGADGEKTVNELLEAHDGERMDTGAACQAIGPDTHVEAVGAVNGADHDCGQKARCR
jgi:hypothetical protein